MSYTEEVRTLIVKAERKLKHALHAFETGDYDSAVGDSYRCIELCMRALLLNRGIGKIPKTHSGLLQLFAREVVLCGVFPRNLAAKIGEVISLRARADYAPILSGIDEADKALKTAQEILKECIGVLQC